MVKSEKNSSSQKVENIIETLNELRVTPAELAILLSEQPEFELTDGKKLVVHDMNVNDFFAAITIGDQAKRVQIFCQIMGRFSLEVSLEGSISLGAFNASDYSWTLSHGESGSLKILSKPSTVIRSLSDVVSLLSMLPVGQAFVLKPRQDFLLTGLSSDAMLDYYRLCQDTEDPIAREKGQDEMFMKASQLLSLKGLTLKLYGLNTAQVDRNIDVNAGGILFKAAKKDDATQPSLVLALLEPKN